jgi:hypothetical protein
MWTIDSRAIINLTVAQEYFKRPDRGDEKLLVVLLGRSACARTIPYSPIYGPASHFLESTIGYFCVYVKDK